MSDINEERKEETSQGEVGQQKTEFHGERNKANALRKEPLGAIALFLVILQMIIFVYYCHNEKLSNEKLNNEKVAEIVETIGGAVGKVNVREKLKDEVIIDATKDYNGDYDRGSIYGQGIMFTTKSIVITLYRSRDVTDEQMKKYINVVESIFAMALSDEISSEILEDYNSLIQEISLLVDDGYRFPSTEKEFARGLKDGITVYACGLLIQEYKDQIPKEKYASYIQSINVFSTEEKNMIRVIEYVKEILQEYVGDPEELLVPLNFNLFPNITIE